MRKYAFLEEKYDGLCKVMIYDSPEGTYVFLYDSPKDTPCVADNCFENLEEAEDYCKEFGINNENWLVIDDPIDGCPHDIIQCNNLSL